MNCVETYFEKMRLKVGAPFRSQASSSRDWFTHLQYSVTQVMEALPLIMSPQRKA